MALASTGRSQHQERSRGFRCPTRLSVFCAFPLVLVLSLGLFTARPAVAQSEADEAMAWSAHTVKRSVKVLATIGFLNEIHEKLT